LFTINYFFANTPLSILINMAFRNISQQHMLSLMLLRIVMSNCPCESKLLHWISLIGL